MGFKLASGDIPLSGYTIRRGIGMGGFGEVYFAVSDSGKEVAMKRIHRNLDIELRGASHCLNLRHPNLVGLFDIRQEDADQAWIVMEYIAGDSLKDRLDREPNGLPIKEVLHLFGQMAAGVQYLHEQGIVHRDLKPANIFIENNLVKIGDYGLSKFISASRRGGQTESVGTFHYMAPEIGKGEYGREIDIYSLGIMLYEMLTGHVPFDGESVQEIVLKHLSADPDLSSLESPYREVIMKAMAKDPKQRFESVAAMLRPLGISIDASGMAVIGERDSQSSGLPVGTDPPAAASPPTLRRRYYQEPIANEIASILAEIQNQFNRIRYGSPWYVMTLIVFIGLLVTFGPAFVPAIVFAALGYVPYYIFWYLLFRRAPLRVHNVRYVAPNAASHVVAKPTAIPSNAIPKLRPISFQEWQAKQRTLLEAKPFANRWFEWTRSTLTATGALGVMSLGGFLVALTKHDTWLIGPELVAVGTWTVAMTLLGSWAILFFAKLWENRSEDTLVYRFVMMAIGLGLGGMAWALSEFLMVPWDDVSAVRSTHRAFDWKWFYQGSIPQLPAFLAYFGLLFGAIRWWRQADVLRRHRFSIFSVLWTVLIASLISGLVYFPTPWCLIVAGATSMLTQIATRSLDSRSRPRFVDMSTGMEANI
ncbi:MAG: serine/threonine-protein kinase [Pirellulaceae bacterium]|nr:serine/threonine-protein kinase [Pirellulaceae bacterium]